MAPKKLYSFRADINLLSELRARAASEETTVSELMHRLLSEALELNTNNNEEEKQSVSYQELKLLMKDFKEEVKEELRQEKELG